MPDQATIQSAPTSEIVVYENGEDVRIDVRMGGDTVWLTQEQMCKLFGRHKSVITRHIANAFKEGEVNEANNMQILHLIRRGQPQKIYDLDVIISVGYRVKSLQGVLFRRWATRILREMLLNKLEEVKRIAELERRVDHAEGDIKQIQAGVNYLARQLATPPPDPPRRKIGFVTNRSSQTSDHNPRASRPRPGTKPPATNN